VRVEPSPFRNRWALVPKTSVTKGASGEVSTILLAQTPVKQPQFWLPGRRLSFTLLALAAVTLAAALLLHLTYHPNVIIGAICNDGWISDSPAVQGRCSQHGGVKADRVIGTLAGQQVPGWVGWARWPLLATGTMAAMVGAIGLIASPRRRISHQRRSFATADRDLGYVDIHVKVESTDSGRQVTLTTPTRKRASATFSFAGLTERGADHLADLLRKRHVRRFGSPAARAVESLGTDLFSALFPAKVEALYRETFDQVRRNNMSLRVSLTLDDSTADLPWEYLFDPERAAYLALSEETSLVRRIKAADATRPQAPIRAVRVLAMAAAPTQVPALDTRADLSGLETELAKSIEIGDTELRTMTGGSLSDLRQALDTFEPHIFYFVGHGSWDANLDDGIIMMEEADGRPHSVTGRDLGVLLNRPGLRLAIFNSCEAARSSQHDRFAGVATSLVAQGVPAAVGMQFRIEDRVAASFGSTFLSHTITERSIDRGLTAARSMIFASPNDVEWGTPVLTSRLPIDDVLPRI